MPPIFQTVKDVEILGLIAVTVLLSGKYHLADRYPTPAEAVASLLADERCVILPR